MIFSKTKSVKPDWSLEFRKNLFSVSHSQVRDLESVSLAKSQQEKVRIVQDADYIYRDEIDKAAEAYKAENGKEPSWMPNQYFAALTNMLKRRRNGRFQNI